MFCGYFGRNSQNCGEYGENFENSRKLNGNCGKNLKTLIDCLENFENQSRKIVTKKNSYKFKKAFNKLKEYLKVILKKF